MSKQYRKCIDYKLKYSFHTHVSYKNTDIQNVVIKMIEKLKERRDG